MRAQRVLDRAGAVQHLLALAEHDGAEAIVDVQHHGGDLRVRFQKLFHEGLLRRENGGCRYPHHHNLSRLKAAPHQHMAQKAAAAALVEDLDLEVPQHAADIHDDAVGGLILNEAVVHRHDTVAARLVDAGDNVLFLVQPEGRTDLVAVVSGVVHAKDGLYMSKFSQKGNLPALLAPELLGVGEGLQLAAAALFVQRAGRRIDLFHA